jgi:hypothetical protein
MDIGGQEELGERVAGYRLIRRLGRGSRSQLFLGRADDADGGEGAGAVVVKIFTSPVDHDLVSDQVAALDGGTGLPALVDLATLPDGRIVIVLERLSGPGLPAVLGSRGRVAPGEAVTILAPVVVALASLHERGFAHTTLSQATVRFQADGRPYLTGLGGLRRLPGYAGRHGPTAPEPAPDTPSRVDRLRDDYRSLALLMRSVFDHLPQADASTRRAEALLSWFEMAATAVPFQPALDDLERRLFDWSPGAAVRLAEDAPTAVATVPARIDATTALLDDRVGDDGAGRAGPALLERWQNVLESDPLRVARRRLRSVAAARRGPLVVVACVATALIVLALTLLPPRSATTQATGTQAGGSQTGGTAVGRTTTDARPPTAAETAGPAVTATEPAGAAPPMTGAIAGDDPVRAATALLAGRQGCLAAASVSCLAAFEQTGSAVMESDSYAIDHGTTTPPLLVPPLPAPARAGRLLERIGDLALVSLTPSRSKGGDSEPASLLLVKGEAGWRLRQIFD